MIQRWTWVGREGKTWDKTYASPEAAQQAMDERMGEEYTLERLAEIGLYLALVETVIKVRMVLRPVDAK